jgi:Sensors of blue-light using FAD
MSDESLGRMLLWETILQKEHYPIFRLTYLSKPTRPLTESDLDDIESKSIEANNARDVTGMLIVQDERILQILEGREDAVRSLYAKIEADPRHTITKLVSATEDDERLLLTWSMVVRKMTGLPAELLEEYIQLYDELSTADTATEITIDHIDLLKVISLFGSLPM